MLASLCQTCRHVREIRSPRGSRFLLCQRSQVDPRFAKYPPQPIVKCSGFEEGAASDADGSREAAGP